jgi:putative nucleotidyltransferase with HDIG domain
MRLPSLKTLALRRRRRLLPRPPRALPVDARRFLIAVGTITVLSVLMSIHLMPDRVTLRIGDRSPTEIRAPRSVTYVDTDATRRLRESAAAQVGTQFDRDPTALASATAEVADLFAAIRKARTDTSLASPAKKAASLLHDYGDILTEAQLRYLVQAPAPALQKLQSTLTTLVERLMEQEIRRNTEDLQHARQDLDAALQKAVAEPEARAILRAIGASALRPNMLDNRERTERLREARRAAVPPVTHQIRAGEPIIAAGEVFTQLHLDKCTALGLVRPTLSLGTRLSILALASAMVLLVAIFVRTRLPRIYAQPRLLCLLALLVITSVFGLRVFGNMLGIPLSWLQAGYLGMMMAVSAGMLIAVLLDASLAVLVTALLSVQSGLIMNHEIRFSVMTLISSLVGIFAIANLRDRMHLVRASAAIAGANLSMVWVLGGLLGDTRGELLTNSAWAVLAAAFAIAIFWFGVAVLEKPFGILTPVWLLELSSSDHPLLRELCVRAPGTYAHSVMVGNLAEAAAEAVGADKLFCRVASYYHDIGKMRRPHCFVENQRAENIHERLSPSLSALIISAHVRDGISMAEQYRLPAAIKAIIREHHGTSLIRYFYHQALSEGGCAPHDPVLEQHFRYDGPKPSSRESGIIMLADSVEAASRCLVRPTPSRISSLIESIVEDKLADGQLDECEITLRDLTAVKAAFERILGAMFHGRIDYPELPAAADLVAAEEAAEPSYGHRGAESSESARTDSPAAAGC